MGKPRESIDLVAGVRVPGGGVPQTVPPRPLSRDDLLSVGDACVELPRASLRIAAFLPAFFKFWISKSCHSLTFPSCH